jgi:hypothetical protein
MPRGGRSWTAEEEKQLLELIDQDVSRAVIAKTLRRTVAAIENRLNIIRSRKEPSASLEAES